MNYFFLLLLLICSSTYADKFTEARIQKAHPQYRLALEKAESSYLRVLEDAYRLYVRRKQTKDVERIKKFINDFIEGKDVKDDYVLPEKGIVKLTSLKPTLAKVGWDKIRVNSGDRPIVKDEPCRDFIFAHASSQIRYDIPRNATYFTAVDCSPHSKPVGFKVVIDGKVAFKLRPLSSYKKKNYELEIKVKIPTNSRQIELITDDLGDNNSDLSYWAFPEFQIK